MRSHDECAHLQSPSYVNFTLSLVILIGIFISYFPQHYRIVHRRSSEGISPYFVLLGSTAGTSAFANIVLLNRRDLGCCRAVSGFECFAGALGIIQVAAQWVCFSVILLLYLIFFPRPTNAPPSTPHKHILQTSSSYRTALLTALIYLIHAFLTILTSLILLAVRPAGIPPLATGFGVLAALLTAVQYFPQLHTTYRLQAVGSLSIPMMLIQTPGAFLWAATLAARMGWAGWSAWGIFVLSGFLQGTLLVMAVWFELRARTNLFGRGGGRASPRENDHEEGRTDDERRPLLND